MINRAPFNNLVDDDGSGLTGTVWNKTQIKQVILDPADEAYGWRMANSGLPPGVHNDFNPGISGSTLIEVAPSGTVNITGFKPVVAPFPGQQILVANVSPQTINFIHEDPGSTMGYRLRLQANVIAIASFWSYATFVYGVFSSGGYWLMTGNRNGHGALLEREDGS
jgi:hypothetical protein